VPRAFATCVGVVVDDVANSQTLDPQNKQS
jgi:hypothetical protein